MGAIWGLHGGRPAEATAATAGMSEALECYGVEHPCWAQDGTGFGARSWPGHAEASVVADEAAGISLVADVRLDDRAALCDALGVAPAARARTADAALLLQAYKRWGGSCAERLTGDYAFAVWDGRKDTLFCWRSPIGERPFYYAHEGGVFAFGTSVQAVLAVPGIPDGLDEGAVVAMLVRPYQQQHPGYTLLRAVRRLRPGHALELRAGVLRTFRRWRPEEAPRVRLGEPDAYAEALLERITRAVEDRLRGGPVACDLSGGLDSSALSVLAARLSRAVGRAPPPTFTWLPRPPTPMPAGWAGSYSRVESVAEQERLRVSYATLSVADVVAVLQRDVVFPESCECPVVDGVYRQAREQGARVLLTGSFSDEFASCNGFWYEQHLLLSGRWLRLLARTRSEGVGVLRRAARGARADFDSVWRSLRRRLWESSRHVNLANAAYRRQADLPPRPPLLWFGGVRDRQLHFLLREELHALTFETDTAAGARHGIECRHPLMDRRVVEFVLGVPPDLFRRDGQSRWLMRRALRSVLPDDVRLNRDKTDPALRGRQVRQPKVDALPTLRQLAVADPTRTRYLDMGRVLAGIDEGIRTGQSPPLRFTKALNFLCR